MKSVSLLNILLSFGFTVAAAPFRPPRNNERISKKEQQKNVILEIYHEYESNPGHRMNQIFLVRRGINLSKTTVLKYMKELKIRSVLLRKKPCYHKGECYKKFDNLLKQDFNVKEKNKVWCTDFTYLFLFDGAKRYNCSILDLFYKSIAATLNSKRIHLQLAIDTLELALKRNKISNHFILHSDQGAQYTSMVFTEYCEKKGVTQSMSKRMPI